jgi:hypothetical protein
MFRTVPLSIIRSYSLYTRQWCMSYRFVDSFRAGTGCLRCGSAATRLLRFRVRIPPGYGCLSSVSVVCCVGSGLCDGLITRPEEFYQLFLVVCARSGSFKSDAAQDPSWTVGATQTLALARTCAVRIRVTRLLVCRFPHRAWLFWKTAWRRFIVP